MAFVKDVHMKLKLLLTVNDFAENLNRNEQTD